MLFSFCQATCFNNLLKKNYPKVSRPVKMILAEGIERLFIKLPASINSLR